MRVAVAVVMVLVVAVVVAVVVGWLLWCVVGVRDTP